MMQQIPREYGSARILNGSHTSEICIITGYIAMHLIHRLLTALGTTKQLSGQSCKQIKKDSSEAPPKSGIYWLHGMQVAEIIS